MKAVYKHTNIIAHDWVRLAQFYEDVFGCVRVPPERHLSGNWLDRGTGVENACFNGIHLRLPGYGPDGPTLEIYQYTQNLLKSPPAANREGLAHLAFEVEDVKAAVKTVIKHGGDMVGETVSKKVDGVGMLTFVYLADPEGNIIELQSWN